MTTRLRPLPVLLLACPVLLPLKAAATGHASGPTTARATIELRVHIPAVLRLMEDRHPPWLDAPAVAAAAVAQELVVLSTLKGGFCATLRLTGQALPGWQVRSVDASGTVDALAQGYRVCAHTPGRHTLRLEHRFGAAGDGPPAPMAWPVVTDLSAP